MDKFKTPLCPGQFGFPSVNSLIQTGKISSFSKVTVLRLPHRLYSNRSEQALLDSWPRNSEIHLSCQGSLGHLFLSVQHVSESPHFIQRERLSLRLRDQLGLPGPQRLARASRISGKLILWRIRRMESRRVGMRSPYFIAKILTLLERYIFSSFVAMGLVLPRLRPSILAELEDPRRLPDSAIPFREVATGPEVAECLLEVGQPGFPITPPTSLR